jgi:hypothetical protein
MGETPGWFGKPSLVYLIFDKDDRLLYIGSTMDLAGRMERHRLKAVWWPQMARVETEGGFSWRAPAYERERELIHALKPLYNRPPGPPPGTLPAGRRTPEFNALDEEIIRLRAAGKTGEEIMAVTGLRLKGLRGRVKRLLAEGRTTQRPKGNAALPPERRRRRGYP